jgi:hypothetical protein
MQPSPKRNLLRNPTIWLVAMLALGALLRCANLTLPPVDYHSWRQTETAALARNYAEEGYRLFHPTVDWRGQTAGYVEAELSLYAYLVALLYGLLGFNEAWARLLSIVITTLTGYLLYDIARRIWNACAGLFTTFVFTFLSPFSLFFGQAIMGDMTVQFFVTAAVYAGLRWTERQWLDASDPPSTGWSWFVLMGAAAAAGGLSKLPALYVLAPLAVLLLIRDGWRAVLKLRNWALGLAVIGVVTTWYVHAYRLGQQTGLSFGIWGSAKVGNFGLLRDPGFYRALWTNFSSRVLTIETLVFAGVGLMLPRKPRYEYALFAWLLSALAYFLYAGQGVLEQDYYTLAILPPLSLYAGQALSWLSSQITRWAERPGLPYKLAALFLFVLWAMLLGKAAPPAGNIASGMYRGLDHTWGFWEAGQWIQAATPEDAGLIVVGGAPPEGLYFSHRHGEWYAARKLAKVKTEDWSYALLLIPYYNEAIDLTEVPETWRLLSGNEWFIAYDAQGDLPSAPTRSFDAPPQWGEQISLLGYDVIPPHLVNGRLYLTLHWQADAVPAEPLVGFVHVWDGNGNFCGQDDHQPRHGRRPTQTWSAGQVMLEPYEIDISGCAPNLTGVRVSAGLYRAADTSRIPLTSSSSQDQLHWFDIDLPAK